MAPIRKDDPKESIMKSDTGENDVILPALVLFITLFAGAFRLAIPLQSSAPLNDGGLFYSMILDIQENAFVPPLFTAYNAANIPLVYPPLALYLTGLISLLFHLSVFDLVRLLPPIFSALCIPAFYLLARSLLASRSQVALAVVIFAFIPRTFDWLIMGGGITRSPGLLFALLAMHQFLRLFTEKSNRPIPLAILFGTLVIYTHPEAALHTIIAGLVFYLLKDRSLPGLTRGVLVALACALLGAPWWLAALSRHGMAALNAPFMAAAQDSVSLPYRLLALFQFKFTDEYFISVLAVLGLIGTAVLLVGGEYLLPAWLAASLLVEPRGASLYMMIPHALMASVALESVVLPALRTGRERTPGSLPTLAANGQWIRDLLHGRAVKLALGYFLLYILISSMLVTLALLQKYTLKPVDLEAFRWVRENSGASSKFVLITGENVLRDASSEWFPALTGRKSLATIFGYEWVNDGRFAARRAEYDSLQACADQDTACLTSWSRETGQAIDYVYIRKYVEDRPLVPALAVHLSLSDAYEQVYDSAGVVIFKRRPQAP
jgi:hypothetical protein